MSDFIRSEVGVDLQEVGGISISDRLRLLAGSSIARLKFKLEIGRARVGPNGDRLGLGD